MSSTLSNCAFNHNRLESLFQKKQVPHIHAHHPRHTYAHFAHQIILILMCMLECTNVHIAVAKGHLAKFCFDKINHINFTNKNVWVPYDATPWTQKKWVSKSSPLMFDVGVGSHKT